MVDILPPHTTSAEIDAIVAAYTQNNVFDDKKLAEDLRLALAKGAGKVGGKFDISDALVVYAEKMQGNLPYFIVAPEAYIQDPKNPLYAHLFDSDVIDTLNFYRKSGNPQLADIAKKFLAFAKSTNGVLSEAEQFILDNPGDESEENDGADKKPFGEKISLFDPAEFEEFAQWAMNNLDFSLVLLLTVYYKGARQAADANDLLYENEQELGDAVLEKFDELSTDPEDAVENQRINNEIQVIKGMMDTMKEMHKTLNEIYIQNPLQLSEALHDLDQRTFASIFR